MKPELISAVRLDGFEPSRPHRHVVFLDNPILESVLFIKNYIENLSRIADRSQKQVKSCIKKNLCRFFYVKASSRVSILASLIDRLDFKF